MKTKFTSKYLSLFFFLAAALVLLAGLLYKKTDITFPLPSPTVQAAATVSSSPAPQKTYAPKLTPTTTPVTPTVAPPVRDEGEPIPTPQKLEVTLTINSNPSFVLTLDPGQNQCDVLKKAESEDKITSLKMEYNSALKSYAVYQINGVGEDTKVWWTYTVNGQKPPLGCSHIEVYANDQIHWQYLGS